MPVRHPRAQLVQLVDVPPEINDDGLRSHQETAGMIFVAPPAVRGEIFGLALAGLERQTLRLVISQPNEPTRRKQGEVF